MGKIWHCQPEKLFLPTIHLALKKILVIRFSSIGDIVLTTPVLRCLKTQLESAIVHVATRAAYLNMLENNPHVDKVFAMQKEIDELIPLLKAEQYDFIVDLHKNLRSFRLIRALSKPSGSFPKLNLQKYLLVNFKVNRLPDVHIVDRYFEAVKALGVVNDKQGLDYYISPDQEVSAEELPIHFRKGYYAFVIGGKHLTKVLPAEKVIEVIAFSSLPVVLLGGPEDALRGDEIVKGAGEKAWNACGKFSLDQSASLLKIAKVVLSNDTGLMHIAAALQKPIVSVWGNTVPEFGMYPYMPQNRELSVIIENKNLSCRPCSKIGYDRCPKKHFKCMNKLDAALIADSLNQLQQKDC